MNTIITHSLKLFLKENDFNFIPVFETFGTLGDLIKENPDLSNTKTFIVIFLWKRKNDDKETLIRLPMIINEKCSNRLKYEFDKDENKFIFTIDVNGQSNDNCFSKGKNFYAPFASDGSLFSKTILDLKTFLRYKDDWMKMFPTDQCWQFVEELK